MKFTTSTITLLSFLLTSTTKLSNACPFSKAQNNNGIPDDETHRNLRKRRILSTLKDDAETRSAIATVIENRKQIKRSLQFSGDNCVTTTTYDDIRTDIVALAEAIADLGDRGHFFGGIVRLAAHDFMDYDRNAENDPNSQALGPDGCLDFTHDANAGLTDIWCDDSIACPFKTLYDSNYSFMSKADFWVASANAVIQAISVTSNARPNGLELPFRWGRIDNDSCSESSARLPEATGCSEVERTFIDRMGLSWRDAVALMGGHTLGRGDINFSGHDGTWVDSDEQSTVFNKRFYEEVLRRAWRPRQTNAGVDWTWGGRRRGVMMLNTDICLYFDIPDGDNQDCCTNTSLDCRDATIQNNQCPLANVTRPEAFNAFTDFLGGQALNNRNQEPFYDGFTAAWKRATESGYSDNELFELRETCGITSDPTPSPTSSPTLSHSTPPSGVCEDVDSFEVLRKDGSTKTMTCSEVLANDKCTKFGHFCRKSCNVCRCLEPRMVCSAHEDCCSGQCNDDGRCANV